MRDDILLRRRVFTGLSLAAVLVLSGCITNVHKPAQAEARDMLGGKKTLVLFRVTESDRKKPQIQKPAGAVIEFWRLDEWPMNKHSGGKIGPLSRSVSKYASTNGWCYEVLPPGKYFLQLDIDEFGDYEHSTGRAMVPRRGEKVPDDWRKKTNPEACYAFGRNAAVPAYVLEIPPGKPVVYAGSFQFTNREELIPDWPPGFTIKRQHRNLNGVLDERAEAKKIIAESLPEFGEVVPSVPVPFDYPPIPISLNQVEAQPAGASTYATSGVGTAPADFAAAPFSIPGEALLEESGGGAAGFVLLLGAEIVHAAVDATVGSVIRKNWSEHETALVGEYKNFGLEQKVTGALRERMDNPERSPVYSLQLTPYRACLRETRFGKYALEVAVHVRLTEKSSGNLVWENFLVYSDREKASKANSSYLSFPYETLVPSSSAARPLDQYTGAAGIQRFQDDLAKAVDGLTAEIESRMR